MIALPFLLLVRFNYNHNPWMVIAALLFLIRIRRYINLKDKSERLFK
jgi:hypothetical protein